MTRQVVLAAVWVCVVALGAFAAPELVVDLATFEFADTVEGLSVAHTFVLTNAGDAETVITSAAPTCGCTRIVTEAQEYRLAPGQSISLAALFDTYGSSGLVSKKLVVKSNAPGADGDYALELFFEGNVLGRPPHESPVADLYYDIYILIDVRDPAAYAAGHLVGAVNMPETQMDALASGIPPASLVVIYDDAGSQEVIGRVAQALHAAGIASVYSLQGGLSQWETQYGVSRIAYGADPSWGAFLEVSGTRTYSQSGEARPYYLGQLLADFILIDLRSPAEYAAGHLAGAINLTEAEIAPYLATLRGETPVVVYSSDGVAGDRLAYDLRMQNRLVTNLLGGLAEWQAQQGDYLLVASGN